MAWQCKLFHYSCVAHLGLIPVFIVHELDRRWHRYFQDIDADTLGNGSHAVECAVPHVVPVRYAANLAERWLEAIDAFRPGVWQTSMYAFGFAVLKLKLALSLTRFVALNDEPYERVGRASIIQYSYGNERWNKH